ncbi:putative calcium-binding protein CML35 [Capsicum chacoense]
MKLIKNYFPKNFFKSKKRRGSNLSRSDDSTTTSSSSNKGGFCTPTSVLRTSSNEWSDLVQALSVIRREKLEAILSRVGGKSPPSEEELGLLLNELEDKSGDGCVTVEEFDVQSADMKDAFDFFDEDHDGKITAEELFNVFRMMGDEGCTLEECKDMIASVDKNGDGFVCFDDFSLMMEQQSAH